MNRRIEYKCPHCGEVFPANRCRDSLIPTHDFPRPCRAVCPGSRQTPRGMADRRPLWKDDPDLSGVAEEPTFNVPKRKPIKVGTVETIDAETGKVEKTERNAMTMLGPAPDKCQECAVDHAHDQPHNKQSLYYQMQFHAKHGRWSTWTDAMAHCCPEVKAVWRKGLIESHKQHGLDVPLDLMEISPAAGR
jgi:hypothetical protein